MTVVLNVADGKVVQVINHEVGPCSIVMVGGVAWTVTQRVVRPFAITIGGIQYDVILIWCHNGVPPVVPAEPKASALVAAGVPLNAAARAAMPA